MGVNGSYPLDTDIQGTDLFLIASSEDGKTRQMQVDTVAAYIQTNGTGKFAIYDGATDLADYEEAVSVGTQDYELRLGFSGPLTEESYFPEQYGTLMVNQLSAPNGTSFDFRFLKEGMFVEFDVEFNIVIQDVGLATITPNEDHQYNLVAIFPNGTQQVVSFTAPTATNSGLAMASSHKIRLSTYIKNELTDSLLGGKIILNSLEAGTNVATISDLKITALI